MNNVPEWLEFGMYVLLFAALMAAGKWWIARRRAKKLEALEIHPLTRHDVAIVFRNQADGTFPLPNIEEAQDAVQVFAAADRIWPESEPLKSLRFQIWPVRYSTQWVFYVDRAWNAIPELPQYRDNPEYTPTGDGWGGMAQVVGGTAEIGVATYHPGRSFKALLAHELTHVAWSIHSNDSAELHAKEAELKTALGI